MEDLGVDRQTVRSWFDDDESVTVTTATVVCASEETVRDWLPVLTDAVRRAYASDEVIRTTTASGTPTQAEFIRAVLPDPGSVMSGDFGEIVTFLYLGVARSDDPVIGPKKWRLKQDRLKPAPHSDVVQFVVPEWPESSDSDRLICAEVKAKATDGPSAPIEEAIDGSKRDRLGRLAKTLAWLDDRAVRGDDLGASTSRDLIQRFLHPSDHPAATKEYWAVVVVCSSLVDAVLATAPSTPQDDCTLLVVVIPELKQQYERVYEAVAASVVEVAT